MKFEYKLLIQSYSESNPSSVHSHRLLCKVRWSEALFPQWRKKRTFRHTVFLHYAALSFLVIKAQFSQSAKSHAVIFYLIIVIIKAPGMLFSLVLVHSICFYFSFRAPDTLKTEGERCNNQRMLYRTEKQPMNFLSYVRSKRYTIVEISTPPPPKFKDPEAKTFAVVFSHLE